MTSCCSGASSQIFSITLYSGSMGSQLYAFHPRFIATHLPNCRLADVSLDLNLILLKKKTKTVRTLSFCAFFLLPISTPTARANPPGPLYALLPTASGAIAAVAIPSSSASGRRVHSCREIWGGILLDKEQNSERTDLDGLHKFTLGLRLSETESVSKHDIHFLITRSGRAHPGVKELLFERDGAWQRRTVL